MIKRLYGCLDIIVIIIILIVAYNFFHKGGPSEDIYNTQNNSQYNSKYILYYFYGDYCGACKKIRPMINQLADEFSYKYIFKPIDVQNPDNYQLCTDFNFNTIPSIYLVDKSNKRNKKLRYSLDIKYYQRELTDF